MKTKIGTSGYISAWIANKEDDCWIYKNLFHLCKNLVPTTARDWIHAQLYTNTVQANATIGANKVAVSETTDVPDESWTTLHGEITTGNLTRQAASPAPTHIAGTNVSIIETTWTPSSSFPNVQVIGLFNATSGGIPAHIGRFDQIASVVSGQAFRALSTINHG